MQGLAKQTAYIFEALSLLHCTKDYTLVGGTALSLQINKRQSEDLDFCIWSKNLRTDKPIVNWSQIEKELKTIGNIESIDVLGFDQVNFIVDKVKLSFFTKQENLSPVKNSISILNNIKAADLDAIAAMKIELILRRSTFRDYYDIYCLLKEGKSIKEMVTLEGNYSNHKLKYRDMLNFLSNGKNYKKEMGFHLLNPTYDVDNQAIEELIKTTIKREYIVEHL
jgi:predicted nucleotidyltransferase component of viral defense system